MKDERTRLKENTIADLEEVVQKLKSDLEKSKVEETTIDLENPVIQRLENENSELKKINKVLEDIKTGGKMKMSNSLGMIQELKKKNKKLETLEQKLDLMNKRDETLSLVNN